MKGASGNSTEDGVFNHGWTRMNTDGHAVARLGACSSFSERRSDAISAFIRVHPCPSVVKNILDWHPALIFFSIPRPRSTREMSGRKAPPS
jgi:hypothetical protein